MKLSQSLVCCVLSEPRHIITSMNEPDNYDFSISLSLAQHKALNILDDLRPVILFRSLNPQHYHLYDATRSESRLRRVAKNHN